MGLQEVCERQKKLLQDLEEVKSRIQALEAIQLERDGPVLHRMKRVCNELGLSTARFVRVPDDYYSRSLVERKYDLITDTSFFK